MLGKLEKRACNSHSKNSRVLIKIVNSAHVPLVLPVVILNNLDGSVAMGRYNL